MWKEGQLNSWFWDQVYGFKLINWWSVGELRKLKLIDCNFKE